MDQNEKRYHQKYGHSALREMLWFLSEVRKSLPQVYDPKYQCQWILKALSEMLPQADKEFGFLSKSDRELLYRQQRINDGTVFELHHQKEANNTLLRKLKEEKSNNAYLQQALQWTRNELHQQNEANNTLRRKLNEEKSNNAYLQQALQGIKNELNYYKGFNVKYTKSWDEIERPLSNNTNELHRLKDKNRYLEQELDRLRNQNKHLSEALQTERTNAPNGKITDGSSDPDLLALRDEFHRMSKEKEKLDRLLIIEKENSKELRKEYDRNKNRWLQVLEKQSDDCQRLKKKLDDVEYEKERLHNILVHMEETPKKAGLSTRSVGNLRDELKNARKQLADTEKELSDVKSRLSRVMGDKLTDNNPNIADLSDKNRPTKISERYQELYDNQWTEAFEIVDGTYKNEEKTIDTLRTILTDTMEFCKEEANRQWLQILDVFSKGRGLQTSVTKQLKDCRKMSAEVYGTELFEEYWLRLSKPYTQEARKVRGFVKECFQICWLMVTQDPPLTFGTEIRGNEPFDKDLYKAYTQSGYRVAFVVWPVLLLHESGPVLSKGVAQGLDGQQIPDPLTVRRGPKTNVVHPFRSSTPSRYVNPVH